MGLSETGITGDERGSEDGLFWLEQDATSSAYASSRDDARDLAMSFPDAGRRELWKAKVGWFLTVLRSLAIFASSMRRASAQGVLG